MSSNEMIAFSNCPTCNHFPTQFIAEAQGTVYRSVEIPPVAEVVENPVPVTIDCPSCGKRHIDKGEWATKPHKTHQCQFCKHLWRPFPFTTVGIDAGRGTADLVEFLERELQSARATHDRLVNLLKRLDMRGGLGLDIHAAIREELEIAGASDATDGQRDPA